MKALYKKIAFSKAHESHQTLSDFLKDYNVYDVLSNLAQAWSQITTKNMRGVWQPILQRPNQIASQQNVEKIIEDIVFLGKNWAST